MAEWKLQGFEAFSCGQFENGGQNLYVSRKGVLQRIWHFDSTNKGYVDLMICNSHGYNEHPSLHVIHDPAGEASCQEVLTQGAQSGAVMDLNADGCDDLVIGVCHDGHHSDMSSYVYFGGKDGITEDRKIDLSAPACNCAAAGDFDGDGKPELVYLVADGIDESSPDHLSNIRLRIYYQTPVGFLIDSYYELPVVTRYFTTGDLDGDGYDDLYCRMQDGSWVVYWGGPEGLSLERCTLVGEATDDTIFEQLPVGGGNVRYYEAARPKILTLNQKTYALYCEKERARLISFADRTAGEEIVLPVPAVISAEAGNIMAGKKTDLVLLTSPDKDHQKALVYFGDLGYETPAVILPVKTPRDVVICDFSGNGYGDIAIAQGRDETSFTTCSLLFLTDENGINPIPRSFVTHNAVEVMAADFKGDGKKQLVFVNQQQSTSYGHVPVYIYLGGPDGYSADRRLEFGGHSPGTIACADFNDDGLPDILVTNNAEDQPFLDPPSYLFWNSEEGFDESRRSEIPTHYCWAAQVADVNRNGYLDIIASNAHSLSVIYGGPDGYSEKHMDVIELGEDATCLWFAAGDLNRNGWLDLVVPLSGKTYSLILWGGPEGYSMERSTKLPVDNALTVRIADLNRNGYPDLIIGTRASKYRNVYQDGSIMIFWGSADGYSICNCCQLPCYQVNDLTIADLNNDGWLDIFASCYFNKKERDINSFIYWNDHGHFSLTNRKRIFAHSSSGAIAGDFNEDGYVDLMVTNHRSYGNHNTESAIWWNGPDGFSEDRRTWLPTIGPHDLVPVDIGNLMTRGAEESYIAPVAEAKGTICALSWEAEIPTKTWVNAQLRVADTPEELENAAFVGIDGTANTRIERGQTLPASFGGHRYFQIKLYLGAVNSGNSPRLTELSAQFC